MRWEGEDFPIQFNARDNGEEQVGSGGFAIEGRQFGSNGTGKCAGCLLRGVAGDYTVSMLLSCFESLTFFLASGLLFMHDTTLFIHGTGIEEGNHEGFERAMRAFPLRTGVPDPEWLVLGPNMDKWSTGGILGAG